MRPLAPSPAATALALATEDVAKNISQIKLHAAIGKITKASTKRILSLLSKAAKTSSVSLGLLKGLAVLVILLALLGIRKDLVSLVDFLKFFRIAIAFVRMMFVGEFAICFFYILGRGISADSQSLIVILRHKIKFRIQSLQF